MVCALGASFESSQRGGVVFGNDGGHRLIFDQPESNFMANLGAPEIILICLLLLFFVLFVGIYRSKSKDTLEKLVWTCIVLLLPFVGAIVYLSVGRKDKFLYHVMKKFYRSGG